MFYTRITPIPDGWDELDDIVDETIEDLSEPFHEDVKWLYPVSEPKPQPISGAEAMIFGPEGKPAFTVVLHGYTASQLRLIGGSNPIRDRVIEMWLSPDCYRGSLFAIRDL